MTALHDLAFGVTAVWAAHGLWCAAAGGAFGTLLCAVPGVRPATALALCLPLVSAMAPLEAATALLAVYSGARYGDAIGAVLLASGRVGAAAPDIDGQQMARQGRAGQALLAAAFGACAAGWAATLLVASLAPALAGWAAGWSPADRVGVIVLALVGNAVLSSGSLTKAIAMTLLGLLLAQGGFDLLPDAAARGSSASGTNIGTLVLASGLFALGTLIAQAQRADAATLVADQHAGSWRPSVVDLRHGGVAALRGSGLGALIGLLPGRSAVLAAHAALALERRLGAADHGFGKGDIRAVTGPRAAISAGAQMALLPLVAIALPTNAVTALLAGAWAQPAFTTAAALPAATVAVAPAWMMWVAAMLLVHGVLLVLHLPLAALWSRLLAMPRGVWIAALTVLCCVGVYAIRRHPADLSIAAAWAIAAHAFERLRCAAGPLLLGFVVGPMFDDTLRRALQGSGGDWSGLFAQPTAAGALATAALLLACGAVPGLRAQRRAAFSTE